MSSETAVVLAAGEGTRLRPLTKFRPKPMLPAANRPILELVLDALVDAGFTDLHLVVGYGRDRVQDHFGPFYRDVPIHYHIQKKQLGSGHALLQAADEVEGEFLVINGDDVAFPETVADVIAAYDPQCSAALGVVESDAAPEYGAVRLSGDRITEIVEKPGTDDYRFLNVGIYAFDDGIFEAIEETPRRAGELSLTDTLAMFVANGDETVIGVETTAPWETVNYPWDLLSVSRHLLVRGAIKEPEMADGVHVADSARIHEDAVLDPPVVVSADTEIGPGAVVGPSAALGRNVTVKANATVQSSVLDTDTRVDQSTTLLDCVTGRNVHLGPGVTVPGGPGDVRIGDRIYEARPLGAVLSDRSEVGGGATLAPGTLVGPEARVAPGAYVAGVIDEGAAVTR